MKSPAREAADAFDRVERLHSAERTAIADAVESIRDKFEGKRNVIINALSPKAASCFNSMSEQLES